MNACFISGIFERYSNVQMRRIPFYANKHTTNNDALKLDFKFLCFRILRSIYEDFYLEDSVVPFVTLVKLFKSKNE